MTRRLIGIAEIDEFELTVRMIEAAGKMKRPPGKTAREALGASDSETVGSFRRAARAAMLYWQECVETMNKVS